MIGVHKVSVRNSRNSYSFVLTRNITVLCGDSGSGKTTLFDMIHEYNRYGRSSGVSVSCDKKLVTLSGDEWSSELSKISNSIVVIDEDSQFIRSVDFARAVRGSDNYYLLITRNYLANLPYSVDEIFELSGAKNKKFNPIYKGIKRMYDHIPAQRLPFIPDMIITEDGKSGYAFFKNEAERIGILCVSAEGKSKIYSKLKEYPDKNVVVIADGAAFGAEMRNIVGLQRMNPNKIALFLPESFEWLILKAGVVDGFEKEKIESPQLYADSTKYLSWEQYFTALLEDATREIDFKRYSKTNLAEYYIQKRTAERIKEQMEGIRLQSPGDADKI